MPLFAIGLLFVSAVLHTAWNLLLKQAGEKYIASWWTVVIGGALFAPVLLFSGLPASSLWPFVLVSALVEAVYFLALSYAYQDHDFSLVYPMARGTAPAFLALWSALFLRERPTPGGMAGLGLIIGGLMIIAGSSLSGESGGRPHLRGVLAALFTAVLISTYTAIDGTAVRRGPALPYALSIFALIPVLVTPLIWRRYGWPRLAAEWAGHKRQLAVIAVLGVLSYLAALAAYRIAPLNYSGAIREVSVVLGAFAGWRFLGEKMGGFRMLGAVIVFAGILVIALFG